MEIGNNTDSIRFTPKRQKIYESLVDLDARLGDIYLGAHTVLLDETNPERIFQSAHSIREITHILSDSGKSFVSQEEESAAKKEVRNNAVQLEKIFDPLGGVKKFKGVSLYDEWNKNYHFLFVKIAHHAIKEAEEIIGKPLTLASYEEALEKYEDFLTRFVFPTQTEILKYLDDVISAGPSAISDIMALKMVLSRNFESYRYFFKKIDATWLDLLNKEKIIVASEIDNVSAEYLSRIAGDAPEKVGPVIFAARITPNTNSFIIRSFVVAAQNAPHEIGHDLLQKIKEEKWLERKDILISFTLKELFEKFIKIEAYDDALELGTILLAPDLRTGEKVKRFTKWFISQHEYEEIIKSIDLVPIDHLNRFIRMFIELLEQYVIAEKGEKIVEGVTIIPDFSSIWRTTIEGKHREWGGEECQSSLIDAIRDLGEKLLKNTSPEKLSQTIDDLFEGIPPFAIFVRLRLFFYKTFEKNLIPNIKEIIKTYFGEDDVLHEYSMLVVEAFKDLLPEERSEYLILIEAGPQDEYPGEREKYKEHWIEARLIVLKDQMTDGERMKYSRFLEVGEGIEHPTLTSYSSDGAWVGPESPLSKEVLNKMDGLEILATLKSWEPPDQRGIFGPSYEGLASAFREIVVGRPEEFSGLALKLLDFNLRPVYFYNFFFGLNEAARNGKPVKWEEAINLAHQLIVRAKTGTLQEFKMTDSGYEPDWNALFKSIADFVEDGLNFHYGEINFNLRDRIFEIIEFLSENSDPTPDHEKKYGGDNMDPDTLSINTVRGQAFHAIFAYIAWTNRNISGGDNKKYLIVDEAKSILKKHLDPKIDPSISIRATYGKYFFLTYSLDKGFAGEIVNDIFPTKDNVLREAAWDSYLFGAVHDDVFHFLDKYYRLAIDDLSKKSLQRKQRRDPIERLGIHIAIGFLFNMETAGDSLSQYLFKKANPEQRGMAISFVGRHYVLMDLDEKREVIPLLEKLKEFWEWRLEDSSEVAELKEFGWWVRPGKFNDQWMLEMLDKTVVKTKGAIDGEFKVFEALKELAPSFPVLVAQVFLQIIQDRGERRFMHIEGEETGQILDSLESSGDSVAIKIAGKIRNHLLSLGYEQYRI